MLYVTVDYNTILNVVICILDSMELIDTDAAWCIFDQVTAAANVSAIAYVLSKGYYTR